MPEADAEKRLVDVPVRADGRQTLVEDPVSVTHLWPEGRQSRHTSNE